jgi:putative transposase
MSISGEGRSFPCSKETGASQHFPLNPTGSLSRRHLAQFVITKYRDKVQEVAVRERIRTIIRQVCKELGVQIVSGILSREHVHMLVEILPHHPVSDFVRRVKGRSSHRLQREFPDLRKRTWGRHFWARGSLLHHQRQHHGRCHPSVSSGARTSRRQPVVIRLLQVNPAAAPRRDHR